MGDSTTGVKPKVHISGDGLSASIFIPMPDPTSPRERYSPVELLNLLKESGVIFGMDQEAIARLAENPVYEKEIVVAQGNSSKEGTPGEFELFFDLTENRKPTIRPDGSTDYMDIKVIEMVHKDQTIAVYHPAVQGARGMSVKGTVIEPKPVRDLPPLAGRGFTRSLDGMTYVSSIDGKIDMTNNRIMISPVWEISSDVDITMGNVTFNGDVIVHGGVSDGAIIKAAGMVTIDGLVENCEIHAGKDLFLLSGLKGGDKTVLECGGNLTAQFIEYAYVKCKGDFIADYVFNSKIDCEGHINLNGNKAAIIGGYTSAIRGIDVNELGNDFGTLTTVAVGVTSERLAQQIALNNKIMTLSANLKKIKAGLAEFERLSQERNVDYKDDPRRLQLLRVKIRDEAVLLEEQNALQELTNLIERAKGASIRVFNKSFPGVNISIDDHKVEVKEMQKHVEYVKTPEGIKMEIIENLVRE